jgi:hypothetical protein
MGTQVLCRNVVTFLSWNFERRKVEGFQTLFYVPVPEFEWKRLGSTETKGIMECMVAVGWV